MKKYKSAVMACDIATQRLQCLNRKLADGPTGETLTEKTRTKLRKYYNEHLEQCEGITLPVN